LTFAVALTACSSSGPSDAPPAYDALFDPLPQATPNTLRGVWSYTVQNPEGPAELRFRFTDNLVLAGVKCTYSRPGYGPLITGQSKQAQITGLDAAKGVISLSDGLTFQVHPDARVCQGTLAKDDYNFNVVNTVVTLTVPGISGALVFGKVGD
jgi:hypothetical protein